MKVIFISDIHGNQYALKAVLDKAAELKIDKIYCLGDLTGYFTGANEVIELLEKSSAICILGNHDAFITNTLAINPEKSYFPAYEKTKNTLLPRNNVFLKKLRSSAYVKLGGRTAKMFHGGPKDELNEYVFPNKIEIANFEGIDADLFLLGHTHLQFVVGNSGLIFANPGSVGLSRNGDFRAQFLSFDLESQKFESFQIPYDLVGALNEYAMDTSINRKFLHNLHFGRSSNKILKLKNDLFIDENTFLSLEDNGISIINTKFGAVLSQKSDYFHGQLLYLAAYENGDLELTSTCLIFNWELESSNWNTKVSEVHLKKDNAGIYYSEIFPSIEIFKLNIINILNNAFATIEIFKNNNVKI